MNGYTYKCEKCGHEYMVRTGGMPYLPSVSYEMALERIEKGEYGEEIRELVKDKYTYIDKVSFLLIMIRRKVS